MREMVSKIHRKSSKSMIEDGMYARYADHMNRRHLLRLWLRDPEYEWSIPQPLEERFNSVYAGVTSVAQVFPLEPRIRSSSDGGGSKAESNENSGVAA